MNLFSGMKSGNSYGVVPGNGNPKADDKVMNAAEGHVVPAENAHIAKKLVAEMGYDPNVKVDMNNGGGNGVNVRISSKEYFLNDDQVNELKARGIDPEMLSPNSPYNKRVNAMENGGSIYSLMTKKGIELNNNNQYTGAAYQQGGGVNPNGFVVDYARVEQPDIYGTRTYDAAGNVISTNGTLSPQDQALGVDMNAPGRALTAEEMAAMNFDPSQLILPGSNGNPMVSPAQEPTITDTPINNDLAPVNNTANPVASNAGSSASGIKKDIPLNGDPAAPASDPNLSPEDAHLQYLMDQTKKNSNLEIGANLAMMGWNLSRERQPMPNPVYSAPRELVRDYEGMKTGAMSDLERQGRLSAYQMRNLGMTDKLVALDANTKENTLKTNQSLWDMQQQDSMRNIAASNQANADYNNKVFQRGMLDAEAANQFSQSKGQNIANNTAQIFDVKENRFNNEAVLKGYQTNQKMNELDNQYNSLNKSKLLSSGNGYVSRDDWYKMTDEERNQLINMK